MSLKPRSKSKLNEKRKNSVGINVVPYIDVMLVLLIIFMITTPLLTQGVKVNLPKATANSIDQNSTVMPLILTVNINGGYFLNKIEQGKKKVTVEKLKDFLIKNKEDVVYVKADSNSSYEVVVKAMVLLQSLGIEKVGLITDDSVEE